MEDENVPGVQKAQISDVVAEFVTENVPELHCIHTL
jgi:hypothetical protein